MARRGDGIRRRPRCKLSRFPGVLAIDRGTLRQRDSCGGGGRIRGSDFLSHYRRWHWGDQQADSDEDENKIRRTPTHGRLHAQVVMPIIPSGRISPPVECGLVRSFAQLKTVLESAEDVVQLKSTLGTVCEVQSDDGVFFASIVDNAADVPPGDSAILRADIDTCRTVHAPPRVAGFRVRQWTWR